MPLFQAQRLATEVRGTTVSSSPHAVSGTGRWHRGSWAGTLTTTVY